MRGTLILIFTDKLSQYRRYLTAVLQSRLAPTLFLFRCHLVSILLFVIVLALVLMASVLWRYQSALVQTFLATIAGWIPGWAVAVGIDVGKLAEKYPTLIGLLVPFLIVLLARPDRRLQRRRIYMDLEFESARIFRISVDHPEIVRYLEASPTTAVIGSDISERVYWYVCQVLNNFELMISLYKEGMVQIDVFSTWVSWFHELGTAGRFDEFWDGRGLSFHYKIKLQEIMDEAQRLLRDRTPATVYDAELEAFHRSVSRLFGDHRILRHFQKSRRSKARRARSQEQSIGSSLTP